jgi:hypothetical protein
MPSRYGDASVATPNVADARARSRLSFSKPYALAPTILIRLATMTHIVHLQSRQLTIFSVDFRALISSSSLSGRPLLGAVPLSKNNLGCASRNLRRLDFQ